VYIHSSLFSLNYLEKLSITSVFNFKRLPALQLAVCYNNHFHTIWRDRYCVQNSLPTVSS